MAAQILMLVALFSNNILAEIIKLERNSHHFVLDQTADFCLISRRSGEEEKLLWNTSQHHNSSLQRGASYGISRLEVSDSGQYQVQCWTQNNVTHERNFTLLVCDTQNMEYQKYYPDVGQTLELTCDNAGPNQSVHFYQRSDSKTFSPNKRDFELSLIDDETFSPYKLQLVKNTSSLLVTFDKSSHYIDYYCLEKNHHRCDALKWSYVSLDFEHIHRSLGESLELNCSDNSGNKSHVWVISNLVVEREVSHNHTLMFPSLTLNHEGYYTCDYRDLYPERYQLSVCPESDPPAVVYFTGGENITLKCDTRKETHGFQWFMRTIGTEGRVASKGNYTAKYRNYFPPPRLVITNISVEDSGEFWCVLLKDNRCVFTSKTLFIFGEPEVDLLLVRSALLTVVIVMMCVVVVATVWRTWSREQRPVPVEEVEMSDLSPASAEVQSETLFSHEHDPRVLR